MSTALPKFHATGELLRAARLKRDYSQAGLADKLKDIHVQFVSNWERGLCLPPSERMGDIIRILRISRKKVTHSMISDFSRGVEMKFKISKK